MLAMTLLLPPEHISVLRNFAHIAKVLLTLSKFYCPPTYLFTKNSFSKKLDVLSDKHFCLQCYGGTVIQNNIQRQVHPTLVANIFLCIAYQCLRKDNLGFIPN